MANYIAVQFIWDGDLEPFASTTTGFEAGMPKVGDRIWITRNFHVGTRTVETIEAYGGDREIVEHLHEDTPPCEALVLEVAPSLFIAYTREAKREHDMRPENGGEQSHTEVRVRVRLEKVPT